VVNIDELLAYQDAAEQQKLSVRARPVIRVGNDLTADQAMALIDGLGAQWLRG
jgi:hypothetical protein